MLKIPIVYPDCVSKLLLQKFFFFMWAAIVSAGKNNIFCNNNGYKQRLSPPVPKRRQFSNLFPWARVKAEKEKNNGKGDSASAPS